MYFGQDSCQNISCPFDILAASIWPGAIAVFGEPNTKMNKMMKKTILNYNIVVKKNVIKNCRVGAFFGYNLADSEISGNIIDNPYAKPVTPIANDINITYS